MYRQAREYEVTSKSVASWGPPKKIKKKEKSKRSRESDRSDETAEDCS